MRAKLFKFCESRRPPYWITFRRPGQFVGGVGPRRPFGIEPFMDYEMDSDDEWEKEGEHSEGELLTEDEEIESADDYEVLFLFICIIKAQFKYLCFRWIMSSWYLMDT